MRVTKGFTLIELMVVVVLASILVTVGYGSYSGQLIKGRRADAHTALLRAAALQEQYLAQNGAYTANMTKLGFASDPGTSENGYYSIDATVAGGNYTLTATRVAPQTNDTDCGDLTFTNLNVKSAVNAANANPSKNCW